jgi:hypothetical protein
MTDGHLNRKLLEKHTPMRTESGDGHCCKLPLLSPEQKSGSCSSTDSSTYSSRLSTPSTASTISTAASSSSGSGNGRRRKFSPRGHSLTAHAAEASHDLRSFSQARNRRFLDEPVPSHSTPALTREELLFDLKGGNGRRKKQDAADEMERRAWLQEKKDLKMQREDDLCRQLKKQQDEWVRKTLDDQQEIMREQAEHERLEDEREERQRAIEEKDRLQEEAQEAKCKLLQQARPCTACEASGKCSDCSGSGCISVTYLSSVVSDASQVFQGRTFKGCCACGGKQNGAELLQMEVKKGTGCCSNCKGAGKTYLSKEEVEAAMRIQPRISRATSTLQGMRLRAI